VDDLPGLAELGVEEKIEVLRRESTLLFWLGIVGGAVFFQLSPIITVLRPWPAAWLTEEQLDRHAHQLATHPVYLIRQITVLLKLVGGMFWGQSPEIRRFLALPAYGADPGTRRTEPVITRPVMEIRKPIESLVKLGTKEHGRGRGKGALASGKVA
jgi:hypothetical protein